MSIGVYCLIFIGTDKVYIGKSINIEKRYKEHLNNFIKGKTTDKLMNAYRMYGKPELQILEETNICDLEIKEESYIKIYDSVNNGFNILSNSGAPNISGYNSCHAKFDKETYIKIFLDLVNTEKSLMEVSRVNNVSRDIVTKISTGTTHRWLQELYPEEYSKMLSKSGTRTATSSINSKVISPEGTIYDVPRGGISKFERDHGISKGGLSRVISGCRNSYKGWKKYNG